MKKIVILLISCFSITTQPVDLDLAACAITAAKCAGKGVGTVVSGVLTVGMGIGTIFNVLEHVNNEKLSISIKACNSVGIILVGGGFAYGCGWVTNKLYKSAHEDFKHLKQLSEK